MMITSSLKARRSIYGIGKDLPVPIDDVIAMVSELTGLVPDAFNMKSSRVVVVHGDKQDALWDAAYDAFGGKVAREKIDAFRAGAGTILYFYDAATVRGLQERFPLYADNFPVWADQASAMLQISVWSGLRELGIGASLQHYNPVIDGAVKTLLDLPDDYILLAQMPFGSITAAPAEKPAEDVTQRVLTRS